MNGEGSSPHLEWLPAINGFSVVSFRTPGHIVFLVSSLDRSELGEVAPVLADQVYRRLAGVQ